MSPNARRHRWIAASAVCHCALFAILTLCGLTSTVNAAEELPLETEIISATIYSEQAQVVRRGEIELGRGSFKLVCRDLPKKLIETSLRVEGTGLSEARIVGIELRRTQKSLAESPRHEELSNELKTLLAEREDLQIRRRAIQQRQGLTTSIRDFSADRARDQLADGTFEAGEWQTLLGFFEEQDIETDQRLKELDTRRAELRESLAWVNSELEAMRVAGGSGREVVIDCEATTPGVMTLELSYLVPDAYWHPEYTVRYIERDNEVELTYSAQIAQATGEDWNEVSVLLSTATPHVGAAPPHLFAQYLGMTTGTIRGRMTNAGTGAPLAYAGILVFGTRLSAITNAEGRYVITDVPAGTHTLEASFVGYEGKRRFRVPVLAGRVERVDFALRPASFKADEVKVRPINTVQEALATQPGVVRHEGEIHVRGGRTAEAESYVEEPPPIPHVEAELASSEFAATIVISKPVDLETGAEPRRSLVVRERLPGRFVLETVPRLSAHVFVRGTFTNPLEIPVLPGAAQVYVETVPGDGDVEVSNFVGQDRLTAVAPGEEFALYLGADQNVKVEHELRTREVLSKAKSAKVRVRYSFAITVESFKREPAELWVLDRVPVSAMRDIKVDDVEITPEPSQRGEDGLLTWKLALEPGEQQELSLQYEIEYPSGMTLSDLGLEE